MTEDQYTEPDREEVSRAMLDKFQVPPTVSIVPFAALYIALSSVYCLSNPSTNHGPSSYKDFVMWQCVTSYLLFQCSIRFVQITKLYVVPCMHLLIPKCCLVQRITLPSTLPSLCLLSVMMMCCTHTGVGGGRRGRCSSSGVNGLSSGAVRDHSQTPANPGAAVRLSPGHL